MKNFKNILATITLTGIIIVGASTAKAGFLVSDFAQHDNQPCTETSNTGILISGLTGILISGYTGIIVTDGAAQTGGDDELCGFLVSD